jgi:hypothetical protein
MSCPSIYAGRRVAFLTQHGKEQVVAPVLEPGLGCVIEHVTGFDTDQLGTFTRDVPRPGSQLEAARRKARKGMELSGLRLGLASEGRFGPDPFSGMFPWNVELLVWLDDSLGIEVVSMAQAAARSDHLQSGDWVEVEAFAARVGFPLHQLVLRPQSQDDPRIHKGIADSGRLRTCFDECLAQSSNQQVFVETDLRAFANPSRMKTIEQAAHDLLQRIRSCCPECETPGYWVTERLPGLPCSGCGLPSSSHRAEVWTCLRCPYQSVMPRKDRAFTEPRHCSYCNP